MAHIEGKSSAPSLAESALHARLRDKLHLEGVKLWLEPFFDEATHVVNDSEITALGSRYATELELCEADVIECVLSLQRNAIERLEEREVFKTTGLATIRLRYSGFQSESVKAESANRMQVNVSQTTGRQLKETIAKLISVHENRLKLISAGRVIDENQVLALQNVKNGGQIMVLSVAGDHETLQQVEDQFRELEETKTSADFLANKDGTDGYSLQVADQSGKPLDLPENEKKALAVALALHEKGRAAMKLQHFSKSLVFLLEADTVYSQCQSSILEMVDNYGLLNLDIAWCYLSLQSIAELPQVEARLNKCERALKRSYGEDMERVIALKGSTGWEAALYVRLHLLQGIASYHLGQIEKSKFYVTKAEAELKRLKISDDQLATLINMGYGEDEARMALRATYGDMGMAVDYIIRKREEKSEIRKQEQDDVKRRKLQKKLGKCPDGQLVSVSLFRNMKDMGYSPSLIKEALRKTNNDINSAIQLITDEAFKTSVLSEAVNDLTSGPSSSATATAIAAAAAAFSPSGANLQEIINNPAGFDAVRQVLDNSFSEESLSQTASREDVEKSEKAYQNLTKNMCSEAEYIDLTLSAESTYLDQYKALLQPI